MAVKYEGAGKKQKNFAKALQPARPHTPTLTLTCVCRLFHFYPHLPLYTLGLSLSVFLPPPPPSPFSHSTFLLWETYSLQDNKGLIGKSGPAFRAARLKETERVCDGITHLMSSLKGS